MNRPGLGCLEWTEAELLAAAVLDSPEALTALRLALAMDQTHDRERRPLRRLASWWRSVTRTRAITRGGDQ